MELNVFNVMWDIIWMLAYADCVIYKLMGVHIAVRYKHQIIFSNFSAHGADKDSI